MRPTTNAPDQPPHNTLPLPFSEYPATAPSSLPPSSLRSCAHKHPPLQPSLALSTQPRTRRKNISVRRRGRWSSPTAAVASARQDVSRSSITSPLTQTRLSFGPDRNPTLLLLTATTTTQHTAYTPDPNLKRTHTHTQRKSATMSSNNKGRSTPRVVCCAIPIARSANKVLLITSRKRPNSWVCEWPLLHLLSSSLLRWCACPGIADRLCLTRISTPLSLFLIDHKKTTAYEPHVGMG